MNGMNPICHSTTPFIMHNKKNVSCVKLSGRGGQRFGCGRSPTAADRQDRCLKSEQRAAAEQTGTLL